MTLVPDDTLLALLIIGLPMMLLAFAILYHAYLYASRPPNVVVQAASGGTLPEAVRVPEASRVAEPRLAAQAVGEGVPAEASAPAFGGFERTLDDRELDALDRQLAAQRAALEGLLSEARSSLDSTAAAEAVAPLAEAPYAEVPEEGPFAERPGFTNGARRRSPPPGGGAAGAGVDARDVIRRLAAEGLSERSIARRLRIGLEEVRLVTRQTGRTPRGGERGAGGGLAGPYAR